MLFKYLCIAVVIIMFIYYYLRKNRIISALFGSLSGIIVLLLLNKYGSCIGIVTELNIFNILGSAILGIPFSLVLILVNFL